MLRYDNGKWITDHEELRDHVTYFYKTLFACNKNWCNWKQTDINFPELGTDEIHYLSKEISIEEVKSALFSMKPWKAPGPYGFLAGLYQRAWDVLVVDLSEFVKETWKNPSRIAEINKTNICITLKIDHPQKFTQFHPISLCNTIYKVITKVITKQGLCLIDLSLKTL